MKRTWITTVTVLFMGMSALVIASPLRGRLGADWMPAINFALGVTLTTLSILEAGRAVTAWLTRAATLGWIGGGLITALGLFIAGASFIVNARRSEFDWAVIGGIVIVVLGAQLQHRARRANPA